MAQEEQNQGGSNISSGGGCNSGGVRSSSKRLKQKKIPQRGLGVAQLEKIRIEEQQKKEAALAAILTSSSTIPTISSSSCFSIPLPNYHHNKPSSSIPFSPSSPNSLLRSAPQIPNIDVGHSSNVSNFTNPTNGGNGGASGGFEIGWSSIPVPRCTNFSKLWNPCENIHDLESHKLDQGTTFHSNLPTNEPNNTVWPLPHLMHRAQQFQQPSSMVNVSSGTSSSSAMDFQMEPPSNQSFYGNFTHMWPVEEKMVGLKRPYPFSLDNPPGPSFQCKFPTFVAPIRSDESTSCGNGGSFTLEQANQIFRDVPSYSSVIYESNSKKSNKVVNFSGDFLSLAPPATSLSAGVSKFKHSSAFQPTSHGDFSKYETVPFHMMLKGSMEYPTHNHEPSGSIQQQQPFYSFFPPAKSQNGQATNHIDNYNGELEGVDLNLKL
ncbi:Plant transcription factor NOZZLE [Dillenia turbinata]|uniref:Plant transcription factor NOZZLE n=1 Tax=Dillenia turbinata TaxID=194707 RepID=A0AAN8W5K3_9MAGN